MSRIPRIYVDAGLESGSEIILPEAARHHLITVLRLKPGQSLVLFNGRGSFETRGEILSIGKKQAVVQITQRYHCERESLLHSELVQAISAGERMDYTLQKCVELGVSSIQLLYSQRSQRPLGETQLIKKLRHWQGVITHAAEQSGRCMLPDLHPPVTLEAYVKKQSEPNTLRLALAPHATTTLRNIKPIDTPRVAFFVGPEGGFTDQELAQMRSQNIDTVQLGPRILRTETAGVALLSWLQIEYGDGDAPTLS